MTPRRNALPALISLLILAGGGLAAAAPRPAAAPALEELSWLQGTWLQQREDGSFEEEIWSAPRGQGMVGAFRIVGADGVASLYELMTLGLEGPGGPAAPPPQADGPIIPGQDRGVPLRLTMRLRHFDRSLAPWKSEAEGPLIFVVKELRERGFTLEDPAREFPREIVYQREGDRLQIRLLSADPDQEPMSFDMRRVDR